MSLNCISINTRGLRDNIKRASVFNYLSSLHFSICFLQEVHLKDASDIDLYTKEWGMGESRWSVGGVHSSGVGVLLKDKEMEVVQSFSVVPGRILSMDVNWRGQKLRMINVYAPTDMASRKECFLVLQDLFVTNRHIIMGGDFNVSLDKGGGHDYTGGMLKGILLQFSLVDGFRKCNPKLEGVTWRNSRGAKSRIDYFFVSKVLSVDSCIVSPMWFSDHDTIQCTIQFKGPVFGGGFWKLNCELLGDKYFRDTFVTF